MKNLKKILRALFEKIAYLLSFLILIKLYDLLILLCKKSYWYSFQRTFKKIGVGSFVDYPFIIHGAKYIIVGEHFNAARRLQMEAFDKYGTSLYNPQIKIGSNVWINYDCHIECINKILL